MALALVGLGCPVREPPPADPARLARAESVLDAFYAWDPVALDAGLGDAEGADAMGYYQAWAEAAHYEVLERRPCVPSSANAMTCAVTVRDDFGTALGYTATDTFRFRFEEDALVGVEFEGDDPPIFTMLFVWMGFDRGEVFDDACADLFDGGETPAACAREVAAAARAFRAWWPFELGDGD